MSPPTALTEIATMNGDDSIWLAQGMRDTNAQHDEQPDMTDTQRLEFDRRIADPDANPDDEISWEQGYAESLGRLHRQRPAR